MLLLFFRYLHKPLVLSRRARATSRWYDAASKANSRLIAELVVDELQRLIGTIEIKNNSFFLKKNLITNNIFLLAQQ